ncbi:hypothetical protein [Demequina gelatinilytica]|uniref:hypothetical protein n=1 Tax=Demequina gelatinilytica TaxID=1638980 RepID=UPI0007817801|nr:hypothetical protein [Demequina gelatinilytica]
MQTFRARSSVIWGWGAVALGVAVATIHVATVGFGYATGGLGLGTGAALFGYAAFLRPRVTTRGDHVEVRNMLQIATVDYARLADLETRWSLELVGDDGLKIGAFAAPAPNTAQVRAAQRGAQHARGDEKAQYGRAGDRLGTPSGDAAAMVHAASSAWKADHPDAPIGDGPSVVRRPDWIGIAVVAVATAAAAWGLFG